MRNKIIYFAIWLIAITIIISISILGYKQTKSFIFHKSDESYTTAKVRICWGSDLIILSTGKVIDLVGTYIPLKKDINFSERLARNFVALMGNREVRMETILKAQPDYPKYDLVEAYLEDGTLVNEKLLKEGMAFFDHGFYKGKDKYEKLEEEAKSRKVGIWEEKSKLKILYIGHKGKKFYHFPECQKVKQIEEKNRIEYYFEPPYVSGYRTLDWGCSYCMEKYNNKFGRDNRSSTKSTTP